MASFFNNQKNAGIALIVMAVLTFVTGIVTVAVAIYDDNNVLGTSVAAIGTELAGILYFGFGMRVKGGSSNNKLGDKLGLSGGALNEKYEILVEYVHVFAIATLIQGVFGIIGGIIGGGVSSGIMSLLIGAIALYCYMKLKDDSVTIADKVIWVILLVLFILTIIMGVLICIGIITIPLGIATIIIGVFMTMALLDEDVKKKFGM